jgi:hypothetical protein
MLTKAAKKKTDVKSKNPKTKMVNILTLDLEKTQLLNELEKEKIEETQSINNIDLLL